MKKMRSFVHVLKNSLVNPRYANDILRVPFGFSLKFYTAMVGVVALIVALVCGVVVAVFPLQKTIDDVFARVPADLALAIHGGSWSINQPLPYTIDLPDHEVPLVIFADSESMPSEREFRASGAIMAITDDTVYALDSNQLQVNSYDLKGSGLLDEETNFSVSVDEIHDKAQQLMASPFFNLKLYAPLLGLLILGGAFIFMWPSIFIGLLIYAFFAWLISKIVIKKKVGFTYGQVLQVSLHSIWLLELMNWIILSRTNIPGLGLIRFLIYGCWTLIMLSNCQKVGVEKGKKRSA
ncbi:DUF1189 domain-containing protein [Microgenomates group bacterium]|nr:DUF1189 domain-containing protein [Microgenomates group bacterium]